MTLSLRQRVSADLIAGVTVAVVALPLALAFGVASGLGAAAGMTSAIVAGLIAAAFGGSRFQVSGPTGAMTVVLLPIVHKYGEPGVLLVGLIAGVLVIAAGVLRLGHLVRRLPVSLIEGFTAGIAVVIALQQIPFAVEAPKLAAEKVVPRAWQAVLSLRDTKHFVPVAITIGVFAVVMIAGQRWPRLPVSLIAVAGATLLGTALDLNVVDIGELPARIGSLDTAFLKSFDVVQLLIPATGVALLAILESLLSATVADRMRGDGTRHSPNRELFGQGIANIVVPFLGGVPATAALARTAVNVRSGAQTRAAAMTHSAVLAAVVLVAGPMVARIPLCALAGVLIATTARMIKPRELLRMIRLDFTDAVILVTTFVLTIAVDLITAVAVGVAVTVIMRHERIARLLPPVNASETFGD